MAESLVGEWFGSAIIPNLVDKVTDYLISNFNLRKETEDLLKDLRSALVTIKATLEVVESHTMIEYPSVGEWLRTLKLLAYEAEDLIDTFQATTIKANVKAENKVSNFASYSLDTIKNLLLPNEDLQQLEIITKRFKESSINIGNLINLVNLINKDDFKKQEKRETMSLLPDEMELVGRDNELGCILDVILDITDKPESSAMGWTSSINTRGLVVIPIVGLGGVGKTALAQVVYNNQQVQDSFTLKAWVSSFDNSDIKILLEKTIQILGGNLDSNLMSLEYVRRKLNALIKNMKFLLVFDDVSVKIEDQWEVLYTILSCGAPRSIVILTTQNRKFANRVATLSPIVLDNLEWEEFLKLFYHHTFGTAMIAKERRKRLESMAVLIAEKLHGLPLSAKIIGNLLRSRIDENEWERISKSEWWNIREGIDKILPSIGLNYQYLSPSLRQCFAYCSIFPKNFLFQKDRLVQMWIAHNFIPINHDGVNTVEDIGRQWFDELVESSFFQPAWDNSRFVMHNLMHDLATTVSTEGCFLLKEDSIRVPQNVYHLAIQTNDPQAIRKIRDFKPLRTLLYFGHVKVDGMYDVINEILSMSKNVRVLDLSHMHMQTKEPPIGIQQLSHLRFLDLSSTGIELLSSSSFEHYHLQTLYLQECKFTHLPTNINNLINLRHLYASPKTIGLIHGIGKLTNLQELNEYHVGTTEGHRVTELREMNDISGMLVIYECENIRSKAEANQANLLNKKHLVFAEFKWSPLRRTPIIDDEILEGLEPHHGITDLLIVYYMGKSFPNWVVLMNDFTNLKRLTLDGCKQIESLPSLGQLPSLNSIIIKKMHSIRYVGDWFYGNTQEVFPALTHIHFEDMHMVEWNEARAKQLCPNLTQIMLASCKNLKNVPLLSFRTSLKHLRVVESTHFTSLSTCLQGLNSLTTLQLSSCNMRISLGFYNLTLLEELGIINCPEMYTEGRIQSLVYLRRLYIDNCPNIFSISPSDSLQEQKNKRVKLHEEGLKSLTHLDVDHSLLHQNYPLIVGNLPSLRCLHYKYSKHNQFTIPQDAWFRNLTSLKELTFSYCDFEHLPESITTLPFLKKLILSSCLNLACFPEKDMPMLLTELHIRRCSPEFSNRCQPTGLDWLKISHVSYITINNKRVQNK